ncbi:MAG TPA: transcription termination factor NusB [Acholeplasmataceae bacterium]|nr:transcription termination factor NusB [Acholeplasmataceae bacterium]
MTQHEKRTQLMHLLYQYDINMKLEIKANYLSDASLLDELTTITNYLSEIDAIIRDCLTNYKIHRLSYVDRAIIRLSTYEMNNLKLDPSISINEALNLTREFSMLDDEKQVKFNNKLLDTISKYIEERQ